MNTYGPPAAARAPPPSFALAQGPYPSKRRAAAVMYPEAMLSLQNGCDNIPGGDVIPPGDGYTVSAAGSYHSGRRT